MTLLRPLSCLYVLPWTQAETGEVDAEFALLDPRDLLTKDVDELRALALEKKEKQQGAGECNCSRTASLCAGADHGSAVVRHECAALPCTSVPCSVLTAHCSSRQYDGPSSHPLAP